MIINFMTFNIQACRNYYTRIIEPELMIKAISDCDGEIICLNEVYGERENSRNQAQEIAAAFNYHYYFAEAIQVNNHGFGNALVSKYNWDEISVIKIPDPKRTTNEYYESRVIIKAQFSNPNFTLLCSHFGLAKSEQINAIETITTLIDTIKTPIIVMGDFNIEPSNKIIKPLLRRLKATFDYNIPTYPSGYPTKRIDYILVSKDLEVIDAQIPRIIASDHRPHTARLRVKK